MNGMMIALQILIFVSLIICYLNAPAHISADYLSLVVSLALTSYLLLWRCNKVRDILKNHFISNTNLFIILFSVICFQFPIDFIFGNDNINFKNYFYSYDTINLSVTFNALCLVSFIIGFIVKVQYFNYRDYTVNKDVSKRLIPAKPLLRIMYILWLGFILFMNRDYVNGGHGTVPVNGISIALYGYFWRINIIYLTICIYNSKVLNTKTSIREVFKSHPWVYWIIILISVFLFLLAHNRVYTFYIVTPVFFYFIVAVNIKTKPILSLSLILCVGVFFTLFKIFGLGEMFSAGNLDVSNINGYDRLFSVSPFTAELAGSIYADSAIFYFWYSKGIMLYGSSIVLGVLRSFSGLVPLFYSLTGLSKDTYDPTIYISVQLSAGYGLGTTISSDLLISLGFCGALIVMFWFGTICCRSDKGLFYNRDFNDILIGLCVASQVVFIGRSSIGDLISTLIFCFVFIAVYKKIMMRTSENKRVVNVNP